MVLNVGGRFSNARVFKHNLGNSNSAGFKKIRRDQIGRSNNNDYSRNAISSSGSRGGGYIIHQAVHVIDLIEVYQTLVQNVLLNVNHCHHI